MMRITLREPIAVAAIDSSSWTKLHVFRGPRAVCRRLKSPLSKMWYHLPFDDLDREAAILCRDCRRWLEKRERGL